MEIFLISILVFFILNFLGKQLLKTIKKNETQKRHPYFLKDDIDYNYKPKCKCDGSRTKKITDKIKETSGNTES